MATAPKPGTTQPREEPPVVSMVIDGKPVVVDLATMTLGERRKARTALKLIDEPDHLEALASAVWVVLCRTEPETDFLALLDKITFKDLVDTTADTPEPRLDDPEA